jgi:hypothetical protein
MVSVISDTSAALAIDRDASRNQQSIGSPA